MAEIGGPFTLISETGETVTEADVITGPTLIYFGYTLCPDICPLDTVRNADAEDILADGGYDLRPVMISVDPRRDTPQTHAEYTENLHPEMLGLTGSAEQVKATAEAYKVYFRTQPADDEYYLVDHSTFSYLMLPEQGFVEFYRREVRVEEMADRIACFIDTA